MGREDGNGKESKGKGERAKEQNRGEWKGKVSYLCEREKDMEKMLKQRFCAYFVLWMSTKHRIVLLSGRSTHTHKN